MENSILNKLPRELLDNIYAMVFKGAMITICVKRPFICFLDWRVFYQFDRNCALAITCRAINRETSAIMWRSAVCRAVTDAGGPLWLYNLRKVLPSQYAKHITHLRNVRIPVADDVVEWCLEPVPESLLGFPNLQSCGFVMDPDKTLYGYDLASAGDVIVSRAGKFKRQVGLDRQILPFMSTDEHITLPEEILEHEFGIDADCTVQMIMRIDFASFPVRCSVTASGRSIAARLIPCRAWLNISTGFCWVEDVGSVQHEIDWHGSCDEEGYRQLLA